MKLVMGVNLRVLMMGVNFRMMMISGRFHRLALLLLNHQTWINLCVGVCVCVTVKLGISNLGISNLAIVIFDIVKIIMYRMHVKTIDGVITVPYWLRYKVAGVHQPLLLSTYKIQ